MLRWMRNRLCMAGLAAPVDGPAPRKCPPRLRSFPNQGCRLQVSDKCIAVQMGPSSVWRLGNTVDQIYLFGLSSRRAEWLASRQAVVAENIANVNTPGYKAKDINAFSEAMESTQLAMANTNGVHMVGGAGRSVEAGEQNENTWDVVHSGNSVTIEQEMLKSGEVSAQYTLNASIAKAFHRFFLTSVKG